MSEPALGAASFEGFARIEEIGPIGMIAFRGDLKDTAICETLQDVTGLAVPSRRRIETSGEWALGWMSTDELIVLLPYAAVAATLDALAERLDSRHHLALDISDARAVFRITGVGARDVLAKLSPVDLSPEGLSPDELRRTRAAQVAAALWVDEAGVFTLICFRSVAQYVFDILKSSAQSGTEIGLYGP